jgi:hypothetical protein
MLIARIDAGDLILIALQLQRRTFASIAQEEKTIMKGIGIDPNPEKSISDELAKLQDDFLRSLLEKGDPAGACELEHQVDAGELEHQVDAGELEHQVDAGELEHQVDAVQLDGDPHDPDIGNRKE